jgi:hypothetical protein
MTILQGYLFIRPDKKKRQRGQTDPRTLATATPRPPFVDREAASKLSLLADQAILYLAATNEDGRFDE